MKTALHQDAKKGSWKVMGGSQLERMRRVSHHRGSISAVSSLPFFLLLTGFLCYTGEKGEFGEIRSSRELSGSQSRSQSPSSLTVCIAEGNKNQQLNTPQSDLRLTEDH